MTDTYKHFPINRICLVNVHIVLNYRILINTLRFYLCVCLCVTDVGVAVTDLRVPGRVQNHHVRFSFHVYSRDRISVL